MADEEKVSANAEPVKGKQKKDRHKTRQPGPSGPPLGLKAARGPRIKAPPKPKPEPKAPPKPVKLGAEVGEAPPLLGEWFRNVVASAPAGVEVELVTGPEPAIWKEADGAVAQVEAEAIAAEAAAAEPITKPQKPPAASPTPPPDPLCEYLAGIRRRVTRIDEYVAEARRSTAETQRYAAQAQAQASEAVKRMMDHRAETAAWRELYSPDRVQTLFRQQRAWVAKTHRAVSVLIQQQLVITGVSSCLDVLQPTPEGRLAVLRALLWCCDQSHDWWREHYRDERTIEQWAQWAVEQHKTAAERPAREHFKDRLPGELGGPDSEEWDGEPEDVQEEDES